VSATWATVIVIWVAFFAVARRIAYIRRYRALEAVAKDTAALAEKAVRLLDEATSPRSVPSVNIEFSDAPDWARALTVGTRRSVPTRLRMNVCSVDSTRLSTARVMGRHVVFDGGSMIVGAGTVSEGTGDWIQRHIGSTPSGRLEASWDELRSEITIHGPTPLARKVLLDVYPGEAQAPRAARDSSSEYLGATC